MCIYHGCTTARFGEYIYYFEVDGAFAAEILAYMAGELRWVREELGEERGPRVHVAHEKENEERNYREEDDIMRLVNRNRYRYIFFCFFYLCEDNVSERAVRPRIPHGQNDDDDQTC